MPVVEIACLNCNHVFLITSLGEIVYQSLTHPYSGESHIRAKCGGCNHPNFVGFRSVGDNNDFNKP